MKVERFGVCCWGQLQLVWDRLLGNSSEIVSDMSFCVYKQLIWSLCGHFQQGDHIRVPGMMKDVRNTKLVIVCISIVSHIPRV